MPNEWEETGLREKLSEYRLLESREESVRTKTQTDISPSRGNIARNRER